MRRPPALVVVRVRQGRRGSEGRPLWSGRRTRLRIMLRPSDMVATFICSSYLKTMAQRIRVAGRGAQAGSRTSAPPSQPLPKEQARLTRGSRKSRVTREQGYESRQQSPTSLEPRTKTEEKSIYFTKYPDRMWVPELRGTRDLLGALTQLARWQQQQPMKQRSLWTSIPKATRTRVQQEWDTFRQVILPELAQHLAIVALTRDGALIAPHGDDAAAREQEARTLLPTFGARLAIIPDWSPPTPKFFEVWKVLFNAWLRNEGPMPAIELAARSASSIPTVAAALARLRTRNEIGHSRNRPVELVAFPRATLREVVALSDSLRRPLHYHDASGRHPDPQSLLKQILKSRPPGVFIGGVPAARHYDPHFNLNGLPRLDIVATSLAPGDWLRRLDPALKLVPASTPSPVIVVHGVAGRAVPTPDANVEAPWAEPAETLLDLYEMRLDEQADQLVRVLRRDRIAA